MAAKKKEEQVSVSPEGVLSSFLKEKKEDHYNFEESHDYKVPSSSLILTAALGGGIGPGAHRFTGITSGGKTSAALNFMKNFLDMKSPNKCSRRGVYIKAEGRLSNEIKERSGIKFVYSADEWVDGTCFVFESNIYEAVFDLKRKLIVIPGLELFFITDSTDGLIKRDDAKKSEEESQTVAGGSLIMTTFLRKVSIEMTKRGHIDIYISQLRDHVKINPYDTSPPRLGKASGARALEHAGDVVLEFQPRYGGDLITNGGKKDKPIGHYCKCKILKTNNENYTEVRYPIKYGQVGGKSVWTSYEIADILLAWELVTKNGAWYPINEGLRSELIDKFPEIQIPEKFHGGEGIQSFIESNEDLQKYLFNKIVSVI